MILASTVIKSNNLRIILMFVAQTYDNNSISTCAVSQYVIYVKFWREFLIYNFWPVGGWTQGVKTGPWKGILFLSLMLKSLTKRMMTSSLKQVSTGTILTSLPLILRYGNLCIFAV